MSILHPGPPGLGSEAWVSAACCPVLFAQLPWMSHSQHRALLLSDGEVSPGPAAGLRPAANGLIDICTNEDAEKTHNSNLRQILETKIELLFIYLCGGDHKLDYCLGSYICGVPERPG